MSEFTAADVLYRAANLIEPEGAWTQEVYARDKWGQESDLKPVCYCAIGAMSFAANGAPSEEAEPYMADEILREVIGEKSISDWNDAPERTQGEVVAKLREAAALAKARGE